MFVIDVPSARSREIVDNPWFGVADLLTRDSDPQRRMPTPEQSQERPAGQRLGRLAGPTGTVSINE